MKKIKVSEVLEWDPCEEAWGLIKIHRDREVTALDVLTAPELDGHDDWRLWVVLRQEMLDDRTLFLFACDCAERITLRLRLRWRDPRNIEAIAMTLQFANGKATEEELAAWADSAWNAADCAWVANRAAAWSIDRAAEIKWQVEHLIERIKKDE